MQNCSFHLLTAWVFVCNAMFNYAEKTGNKLVLLLFIIPTLGGMLLYITADYYKAAGTILGFYLGYLIEPKYIDFNVKCSLKGQVLKVIFGLAVVLSIKIFLKALLPVAIVSDFVRYFIIAVWITIIMPVILKKFDKSCQ